MILLIGSCLSENLGVRIGEWLQRENREPSTLRKTALTLPCVRALGRSMQKMQILFPDPLMGKLRAIASEEDRPVSELIRRAVEKFLEMKPEKMRLSKELLTFRGGKILVSPENLKDVIYDDESL
jgi:hypothetical protein